MEIERRQELGRINRAQDVKRKAEQREENFVVRLENAQVIEAAKKSMSKSQITKKEQLSEMVKKKK